MQNGKVKPYGQNSQDTVLVASKAKQKAFLSMKKYLVSVLPTVYHSLPWLRRLKEQLFHHHKYISFFTFLMTFVGFVSMEKWRKRFRISKEQDENLSNEQMRKKSLLQIAYLLSAIMMSCFTLSVVYDIQFPADDGSKFRL
jgi:undecaprenyl pyrophosphate phosphatase UppP